MRQQLLKTWLTRLMPDTLKRRVVLIVVILLSASMTSLSAFFAREQTKQTEAMLVDRMQALASLLSASLESPFLSREFDEIETLLVNLSGFPELTDAKLISPTGEVLLQVKYQLGKAPTRQFKPPVPALPIPDQDLAIALPTTANASAVAWQAVGNSARLGWVRMEFSTASLSGLNFNIWRNALLMMLASIGLASWLLMRFLQAPINSIQAMDSFSREMLEARNVCLLDVSGPREIRSLQRSLNETSVLLQQHILLFEHSVSELQANEAKLAAQNALLESVFASSPDGLLTLDQDDRVSFVNAAFLRFTGLSMTALIGLQREALEQLLSSIGHEGSNFHQVNNCLRGPAGEAEQASRLVVMRDERKHVLALSSSLADMPQVRCVLHVSDITKQVELDTMKSEFLAMAAHELRTPMVSIYGFTELMLNRTMTPEKQRDLLGRIHRQGALMIHVINELLDLARIEARRGGDFVMESVDLGELVMATVADFQPPVGREAPECTPPTDALPAVVDRGKMQQAVLNVLSNAYKYSPDGGAVHLSFVRGDRQGQRSGVVIRDHGMGMNAEQLAHFGERFYRADTSGHIPGTGLGISIVKELLNIMGGRLEISSEPGQGSTVTLWV